MDSESGDDQGVSTYLWLLAHAPEEIPEWFRHREAERPASPNVPQAFTEVVNRWMFYDRRPEESLLNQASNTASANERNALEQIEQDHRAFWEADDAWKARDVQERYLQWREHWAEMMLQSAERHRQEVTGEA